MFGSKLPVSPLQFLQLDLGLASCIFVTALEHDEVLSDGGVRRQSVVHSHKVEVGVVIVVPSEFVVEVKILGPFTFNLNKRGVIFVKGVVSVFKSSLAQAGDTTSKK